jgi:hypothetical protein
MRRGCVLVLGNEVGFLKLTDLSFLAPGFFLETA